MEIRSSLKTMAQTTTLVFTYTILLSTMLAERKPVAALVQEATPPMANFASVSGNMEIQNEDKTKEGIQSKTFTKSQKERSNSPGKFLYGLQ